MSRVLFKSLLFSAEIRLNPSAEGFGFGRTLNSLNNLNLQKIENLNFRAKKWVDKKCAKIKRNHEWYATFDFNFSGQVQLVGQSRMDDDGDSLQLDQDYSSQNVALRAQVIDKYAFNALPRHESIRDLLHLQSQQQQQQQKQKFRPNEEWSPAPEGKVWYQINRPSFRRRR